MKTYTTILLIIFCLFGACKSVQQIDVPTTAQSKDSITSDEGNLLLLIERAYLASKAFKTGKHKFNGPSYFPPELSEGKDFFAFTPVIPGERPAPRVVKIEDGKWISLSQDDLEKISPDDIESLTIDYNILGRVHYGLSVANGLIIIKLKE